MAHPAVGFTLTTGERAGLKLTAQPLGPDGHLARLGRIMGREFLDDALPVDIEREGVRVTGFAGLPTLHRPDPGQQYLFVNGRPVKDKPADRRRARGLRRPAAEGRAIRCWRCSWTLPPREVDVNVHPSKAEVRFRDAGRVRALVAGALRQALEAAGHRATAAGGSQRARRTGARADRTSRAARRRPRLVYAPQRGSAVPRGLRRGLAGPARGPAEPAHSERRRARRGRAAARGPARPAARRRPRAAARDLHRRPDAHLRRHRRPARRARAPGLRAPEGRARQRRRRAPGPADPRDRRARRRRGRGAGRARAASSAALGLVRRGVRAGRRAGARGAGAARRHRRQGPGARPGPRGARRAASGSLLEERLAAVCSTMACHGSVRAGRRLDGATR